MPTLKQKKVAQTIVESIKEGKTPTAKEILKTSNYKQSVVDTKSTYVLGTEGVQEALEELGFTEDNAKSVVTKIMLNEKVNPSDRLKATDQVFKVRGSYAPEKSLNINVEVDPDTEKKVNNVVKRYLSDGK